MQMAPTFSSFFKATRGIAADLTRERQQRRFYSSLLSFLFFLLARRDGKEKRNIFFSSSVFCPADLCQCSAAPRTPWPFFRFGKAAKSTWKSVPSSFHPVERVGGAIPLRIDRRPQRKKKKKKKFRPSVGRGLPWAVLDISHHLLRPLQTFFVIANL